MNADGPTLQALVIDRKGGRSYEQLAMRSGGRLTRARIQQIATRPTKAFPDPETLTGLGLALGVPVQQVVLAAARSLGLDVRGPGDGDALTIPGGKRLTWTAQDALLTLARELPRVEERDEQRDDSSVDDQPQSDGVTTGERAGAAVGDAARDRPWEKDEFALAAKRGRNIGAEIRRRQDDEAEASQDNEE